MEIIPGPLLKTITSPDDLKKLSREQLHQITD
jgi:1-deoxy-D-xylulose-5-phosphate synthase